MVLNGIVKENFDVIVCVLFGVNGTCGGCVLVVGLGV